MPNFFRPARRSEAKPLVGIYGLSNSGKTFSSLLLARGYVGPQGKIGMIETEAGRGEAYCDVTEYPEIGGYDVAPLRDEFSATAYFERVKDAEKGDYDALLVDSASHEWEASGGVLDQAAQNDAAGKIGPLVWQGPKLLHKRHFVLPITQTPIPLVIVLMRAKYPMVQVVKNGKKAWERSDRLEPTQSDDIISEMFIAGWIDDNHNFHIKKITNRSLEEVFIDNKPITVETGRKLREWAEQRARSDETPKVSADGTHDAAPAGHAGAAFQILKQSGPSPCDTIGQWRERMLDGISRSAPHQAKTLWDRNADLMAEYERGFPGDVAVVIEAFEAKVGK